MTGMPVAPAGTNQEAFNLLQLISDPEAYKEKLEQFAKSQADAEASLAALTVKEAELAKREEVVERRENETNDWRSKMATIAQELDERAAGLEAKESQVADQQKHLDEVIKTREASLTEREDRFREARASADQREQSLIDREARVAREQEALDTTVARLKSVLAGLE